MDLKDIRYEGPLDKSDLVKEAIGNLPENTIKINNQLGPVFLKVSIHKRNLWNIINIHPCAISGGYLRGGIREIKPPNESNVKIGKNTCFKYRGIGYMISKDSF